MHRYDIAEMTRSRADVVTAAQELLDGKTSVIACARRLVALRSTVTRDDFDPDFLPFVVIASETDTLPVGKERAQWSTAALAAKDVEIRQAEERYRPGALAACHTLVARFCSAV